MGQQEGKADEEGKDGRMGGMGKHGMANNGYVPIVCDAECLLAMRREEIFCLRPRVAIALGDGSSSSSSSSESVGSGAGDASPSSVAATAKAAAAAAAASASASAASVSAASAKAAVAASAAAGGGRGSGGNSSGVSAATVISRMGNDNLEGRVTYDPSLGRGVQYCRFFRNMLADTCPIAVSQIAGQFFMEEDFELALLKEDQCPFSRTSAANVNDYSHL